MLLQSFRRGTVEIAQNLQGILARRLGNERRHGVAVAQENDFPRIALEIIQETAKVRSRFSYFDSFHDSASVSPTRTAITKHELKLILVIKQLRQIHHPMLGAPRANSRPMSRIASTSENDEAPNFGRSLA